MENVDLGSEIRSELHSDDIAGRSQAVRRVMTEMSRAVAPFGFNHPNDLRRERHSARTHSIRLLSRSRVRSPAALT